MEIKCEKCWQKGRSNKNGKTRDVSQRYRCKHCEKNNTPIKKERMYPEELKDRAIELYMEGNSGRTVGRLLKISKNMCLRWIGQKAKKQNQKIEEMK